MTEVYLCIAKDFKFLTEDSMPPNSLKVFFFINMADPVLNISKIQHSMKQKA